MTRLRWRILGPLEAERDGRPLALGPYKQRVVLALLLCNANRTVSVGTLRDALWEDSPPRTAAKNIQVYVSALRRLAGGENGIVHSPPGYLLRVEPDHLDLLRFHELARAGRAALRDGDPAAAADLLGRAVRTWRGPALPELATVPAVATAAARLREHYLAAYEDWAETMLRLGRHTHVVEEIGELARRHPFRERLRHAQLLALHRCGRRAEALAQFDMMRQRLARDLGLPPSPVLARLYDAILAGEESAAAAEPAAPVSLPRDLPHLSGRDREVRTLLDLLRTCAAGTVVAVSGPAGVGKTGLVTHCAHRLAERFPDGRILLGLRAADGRPRPVPELLDELLARLAPGAGGTDRAASLRRVTAGRRLLVIADDVASEAQARALLSAVEDGVVVVTGRRHLAGLDSSRFLSVQRLPDGPALDVLSRLVGAERVAAEPDAARRIVAACDGLPLGLRIVGAKLAGLPHLRLARYADRLADPRRLLGELVAGDLDLRPRLTTWTEDLDPAERESLGRLVTTDDTFTAAEAAATLGTDPLGAEAILERLVQAHLVEADDDEVGAHDAERGARYRLPSLVRAFVGGFRLVDARPSADRGGGRCGGGMVHGAGGAQQPGQQ